MFADIELCMLTFVQEYERVLVAFLDRFPPISYDPTTSDIQVVPSFPLNLSAITIQRHVITAFIQLYSAADLYSPTHRCLYEKRLTMAKRSLLLIKIVDAVAAELHCSRQAPFGNVSPPEPCSASCPALNIVSARYTYLPTGETHALLV